MKTKYTLLMLSIFLAAGNMFSQPPGYMGKRLTLGYSNNFFVALAGPTAKSYDAGINTTHSFNAEYTIKNRTNLCLSFQMFNTGVNMDREFRDDGNYNYNNYIETYKYSPVPDVPMHVSTKSVGLGFKFFPRGALAPVGRYKKLELLIMFSNLTYEDKSFVYTRDYGYSTDPATRVSVGSNSYSYKTFAVNYTMGRQRVLFNRLVLDYGMQVGFLPAGFFGTLGTALEFSDANDFDSVFRQETNKRLFRYQLFNLHIGLGFLAI